MSARLVALLPLLALVVSSAACGGPGTAALGDLDDAKIETQDDAYTWGKQSAPVVFSTAALLVMSMDPAEVGEADCPVVTKNGDTIVFEGGCTDEDGVRYEGRATYVKGESIDLNQDELPTGDVELEGWTKIEEAHCGDQGPFEVRSVSDGVARIVKTDDGFDFELDLAARGDALNLETCELEPGTLAYAYSGSAFLENDNKRQTWNGSGRMGDAEIGKASARTEDEVTDSTKCNDGALSGSTTIESGDHTLVVTYDGATDCDESGMVTLNGEDLGEVEGLSCATGTRGGGFAGLWAILAVGALVLRRRRS